MSFKSTFFQEDISSGRKYVIGGHVLREDVSYWKIYLTEICLVKVSVLREDTSYGLTGFAGGNILWKGMFHGRTGFA